MTAVYRPFEVVLRELLIERGYVTPLGNANWAAFALDLEGVHYESLRKAVTRDRDPSVKIMENVARALGVEPDVFVEYRLARARRDFDRDEVGEQQALANLETWRSTKKR